MLTLKKIVRWLLLLVSALLILSGFGVTYYQAVGPLTLGILDKATSFQLHNWLVWPFVVLLVMHVALAANFFRKNKEL